MLTWAVSTVYDRGCAADPETILKLRIGKWQSERGGGERERDGEGRREIERAGPPEQQQVASFSNVCEVVKEKSLPIFIVQICYKNASNCSGLFGSLWETKLDASLYKPTAVRRDRKANTRRRTTTERRINAVRGGNISHTKAFGWAERRKHIGL